MKIGICAFPLSRGKETGRGLERVVDEFCNYLSKRNIPFDFYELGIITSEIKSVLLSNKYLSELRNASSSCYFAVYAVSGVFPVFANKKPLVTLITDLIPFHVKKYDNRLKYALKRWCVKHSCKNSDHLIVGSSSIKRELINRFHLNPNKITIVPWGVSHVTFYPNSNVRKVKNRISFLGEAKRAKGIDSIIKAFKYVLEKIPDATLFLASNGYEFDRMVKLARQLLPANSYKFQGFIPEDRINEFYNSSDLFIFPSRYGFGLSALEAMACGVPTLVGDTLDAKDFFTDNDMLVNPDDEKQIAEKLIYLMLNEDIKINKSKQALGIARQFSWEEMGRKYYDVCLSVINSVNKIS